MAACSTQVLGAVPASQWSSQMRPPPTTQHQGIYCPSGQAHEIRTALEYMLEPSDSTPDNCLYAAVNAFVAIARNYCNDAPCTPAEPGPARDLAEGSFLPPAGAVAPLPASELAGVDVEQTAAMLAHDVSEASPRCQPAPEAQDLVVPRSHQRASTSGLLTFQKSWTSAASTWSICAHPRSQPRHLGLQCTLQVELSRQPESIMKAHETHCRTSVHMHATHQQQR